jgi:hypothetical protein
MKSIILSVIFSLPMMNSLRAETLPQKNYEMKELSTAEVTVIKKTEQAGNYSIIFRHHLQDKDKQIWGQHELFLAPYLRYQLIENQPEECNHEKEFSRMGKQIQLGSLAEEIEIPARTFSRIKGAANSNTSSSKKTDLFCVYQLHKAWIVMSSESPVSIENQGENAIPVLPTNLESVSKAIILDYTLSRSILAKGYPVCLSRDCFLPVSTRSKVIVDMNAIILPSSFQLKE